MMATTSTQNDSVQAVGDQGANMSDQGPVIAGHPMEQLEVEEGGDAEDDDTVYPNGTTLWLALAGMYVACFLNGLDLTIVAVAIPSLTDQFKTVNDIGWYSAAYGMVASAFVFFFGRLCTVMPPRDVVLIGLTIFVMGSLICTLAQSSNGFIVGRAVCGLGICGFQSGALTLIVHLFPKHKRSIWLTLAGAAQSIGLSSAPVIGGVLIDSFGWRACFGINLPLCPLVIAFTWYFTENTVQNPNYELSWKEKLKLLDIPGTLIVVPSITCLLLGLQWGGIKYGWKDARIIVLFVVFAVLAILFGYRQYQLGEAATIPPRIAKKRSILAAMWFSACCNGILATTEAYISIYWQGVRNESATKAGLLGVSMIIGILVGGLLGGFGTTWVGYFTPFMFATTILAPIASGLLTTLNLDSPKSKTVALLGFLGFAVGVGINGPIQAVSVLLKPTEVSMGSSMTGFAGGMGSALFICASATLFQGRLVDEISQYAPGTNTTAIIHGGLSDIRHQIGAARLEQVLTGYDKAVVQTLYMPLALAIATVIGSAFMEWPSVKKKQS